MKKTAKQVLSQQTNSNGNKQQFPFLLTRNPNSKFPRYVATHEWQQQEIHKAAIFLVQFQNQLKQPNQHLRICYLHALSQFVFTRNFNQCRLYYQSVMRLGINTYLQEMRKKYPQIDQQRKQYYILLECIRSNCNLQQNSLDIDFSLQTGNNHLRDNFLNKLNKQSHKQKVLVNKQQSEDWDELTEKDYQNNFVQNLHVVQKQSNLSMQLLLAQKYKDKSSESVCNIYRVDPFPYKMPY